MNWHSWTSLTSQFASADDGDGSWVGGGGERVKESPHPIYGRFHTYLFLPEHEINDHQYKYSTIVLMVTKWQQTLSRLELANLS